MAKNLECSFLLDFYGSMLGEKQRRLFALYYDDDLSLAEIADLEGMTRQGVRDAVKRAEQQLFAMEERLGLAKRFRQVKQGLLQVRACAEELYDTCLPPQRETVGRLLTLLTALEEVE